MSSRRRLIALACGVLALALAIVAVGAASVARTRGAPRRPSASIRPPPPTNLPPRPPAPHRATRSGIELGRRLFFDVRLSGNDAISCATCHDPARAFTDGVARSSRGVTGLALARNTPTLANIAWARSLFWDGGSRNLESLALGPVTAPDEMGETVERMIGQLAADAELRAAFALEFPGEGLAPGTVMRALAQYLRSLVSATSRYDRYIRGEPGGELDGAELRGLATYRAKCAACHATDLFTDQAFHDIGLDPPRPLAAEDPRRGRARVTFRAEDERAFRTPTLRNLRYTAPYMHDGRFATLDEVLAHYRRGVHRSPALAAALVRPDGELGIPLTDAEARDLREFLATLDDDAFAARHANDARDARPQRGARL